jgi:hypothetical protein
LTSDDAGMPKLMANRGQIVVLAHALESKQVPRIKKSKFERQSGPHAALPLNAAGEFCSVDQA